MDRIKEAANVIVDINRFKKGELQEHELVSSVCNHFDVIKNEKLSNADFKFLKYISNLTGIPHFYDILAKFENEPSINTYGIQTISSLVYESTLHVDEENKLHKYQMQILDHYHTNEVNRYFLSASTSFGKTHLVYEIIRKMSYQNILLIFPTISLLSENQERIFNNKSYSYINNKYAVHTLSEVEITSPYNIFIYTPERYLSFIEKSENRVRFDFCFIDEIYKIDNDYLIDDLVKENERDVAYRLAAFYSLQHDIDVLLAGPYVEFPNPSSISYNGSIDNFLRENDISVLNYNEYEIVNKSFTDIKTKYEISVDEVLNFKFKGASKAERLIECIRSIRRINQNTIIYCSNRGKNGGVEGYALKLIDSLVLNGHDSSSYSDLMEHLSINFRKEWVLVRALYCGIGIHHGLIPKYIQKEIIRLFNIGKIHVLISTTTITEGVNTSAKNLIVMQNTKGGKPLKKFDAKNIAGRAGRFGYHYSGRVISLQNNFMKTLDSESEVIKHKNYDVNSLKDEIDLFHSDDKYLSDKEIVSRKEIIERQRAKGIPDFVINQYKVISRIDKMLIYDKISELSEAHFSKIEALIKYINFKTNITYEGFQIILNIIFPIIKNESLKFIIDRKINNTEYSILNTIIQKYLKYGFKGSVEYYLSKGESVDSAISNTSKFVYNTLKYQIVKYLGVFNIMYKFYKSQVLNKEIDDIHGIDKLLLIFEYNALTENGRIASDYGVPTSVIEYYENIDNAMIIREKFDNFEIQEFNKIELIIKDLDKNNT